MRAFTFALALCVVLGMSATAWTTPPPRIEFEGFLFPDNVRTGSTRSLSLCLVNHGGANQLLRDDRNDDHLTLSIPLGPEENDLETDGNGVGCSAGPADWDCSADIGQDEVSVMLGPAGASASVAESATLCFEVTGVFVNMSEGLALCGLEQSIKASRARQLRQRPLPVIKTASGIVRHPELAEVEPDQHHTKTTSFGDLVDRASDAQIPDDITIDHAATADHATTAGDADTVDGRHAAAFVLAGSASLGAICSVDTACASGHCKDGVCCNGPCDGTCESCALSGSEGICSPIPAGTDPDGECIGAHPQCGAVCGGSGQCEFPDIGTKCGLCKTCDGVGRCLAPPLDDDDCGEIVCDGLNTPCRVYHDLTSERCAGFGQCKKDDDAATCTRYTDIPCLGACCDGTNCIPDITQPDCETLGGVFQGVSSDCSPNPC